MRNFTRQLVEEPCTISPDVLFELDATSNTPKIVLDSKNGKVVISGHSAPLAPSNFFNPVIDWLRSYKNTRKKGLEIYIILDYFNTYTAKFLMRLNKESVLLSEKGQKTKIYWFCDSEDNDMYEFGEHMKSLNKKGVEFCFINDDFLSLK